MTRHNFLALLGFCVLAICFITVPLIQSASAQRCLSYDIHGNCKTMEGGQVACPDGQKFNWDPAVLDCQPDPNYKGPPVKSMKKTKIPKPTKSMKKSKIEGSQGEQPD